MDPSLLSGSSYVQYGIMPSSAYAGAPVTQYGGQSPSGDHSADPSSSHSPGSTPTMNLVLTMRLLMQGKEVGSIIGKRGEQVKKIREESGAKVNISDGSCPERIVTVTGTVPTINKAFEMICNKFEEDMLALPNSVPKPPITMRLIVPATQCGSLIGKGGSKIKEIREATGASIQVASEMLPQSTERAVTLSGTADAMILCIGHVAQILLEAPPKGATIPFRPKPTFNSVLIASSAAAAAQQQQLAAALLQPSLQNLHQMHPGLQQFMPHELVRGVPTSYGHAAAAAAYLPPTSMTAQDYNLLASSGLLLGGAGGFLDQSKPAGWPDDKQLQLMQQYAAINNSVFMGAPLLKATSPPSAAQHHSTASGAAAHKGNNGGPRFAPY